MHGHLHIKYMLLLTLLWILYPLLPPSVTDINWTLKINSAQVKRLHTRTSPSRRARPPHS